MHAVQRGGTRTHGIPYNQLSLKPPGLLPFLQAQSQGLSIIRVPAPAVPNPQLRTLTAFPLWSGTEGFSFLL